MAPSQIPLQLAPVEAAEELSTPGWVMVIEVVEVQEFESVIVTE